MNDIDIANAPFLHYGPGATEPDLISSNGISKMIVVDDRVPGTTTVRVVNTIQLSDEDRARFLAEATDGGISLASVIGLLQAKAAAAGVTLSITAGPAHLGEV